jgi:hypothetical protein
MKAQSTLTLAALLALAQSAVAQQQQCQTFVYVGAQMTVTNQAVTQFPGPPLTEPPAIGNPIVGMIQLNTPLPPGTTTTYPVGTGQFWVSPGGVIAWDFMSESPSGVSGFYQPFITEAPYDISVTFTSDANDNVTDWNFMVQSYDPAANITAGGYSSINSTPAGDSLELSYAGQDDHNGWNITGVSKAPGQWTCLSTFITQAAAQNATLTATVDSLTTDNAALVAELHRLQAYYTATIADDQAGIASLRATITKLEAEIAKLEK